MFNETRKQLYISYLESINYSLTKSFGPAFEYTSDFETSFQKDLCDFTIDEIIQVITEYKTGRTFYTTQLFFYKCRMYCKWCMEQGYASLFVFEDFRRADLIKLIEDAPIKKSRFMPEQELQIFLDATLLNDIDKFILRCIYEGIEVSEIAALKRGDLNKEKLLLHTVKGDVPVTQVLIDLGEAAIKETEYKKFAPTYNRLRYFDLELNDYIVRFPLALTKDDKTLEPENRAKKIKFRMYNSDFDITLGELRDSGFIQNLMWISEETNIPLRHHALLMQPQTKAVLERYKMGQWMPYMVKEKMDRYL